MSFTQPICEPCWCKREPGRKPCSFHAAPIERCCICGVQTRAGIYVRVDPSTVKFPKLRKG